VHEQEVVIVGYTGPRKSRKYFGALALAVRDKARKVYAGHVGTSFNAAALKSIYEKMQPLRSSERKTRSWHDGTLGDCPAACALHPLQQCFVWGPTIRIGDPHTLGYVWATVHRCASGTNRGPRCSRLRTGFRSSALGNTLNRSPRMTSVSPFYLI
jgi:hypothetical protein